MGGPRRGLRVGRGLTRLLAFIPIGGGKGGRKGELGETKPESKNQVIDWAAASVGKNGGCGGETRRWKPLGHWPPAVCGTLPLGPSVGGAAGTGAFCGCGAPGSQSTGGGGGLKIGAGGWAGAGSPGSYL